MSLLQQIKGAQLIARKSKATLAAALLTTLIGEAEMIGKNAGNRETTDAEVVAVIKKFIKNIDETLEALKFSSDGRVQDANLEKRILETFLPKQLSEDELRKIVEDIKSEINATQKDMGKVMGLLKARHDGLYDGKLASTLVKNVLA